jgi:hypothetical protein
MADPTIFEYQLKDDQGLTNRNAIYVAYNGATETVDALIGAWLAYGGLLDAITDARIVEGRITIPLIKDPSWKAAPIVGNNVNQIMALNFNNDTNTYLTDILIPAYKESLLSAGTRVPNLAAVPLAAYIAAIIAGSGAVFPNSRDIHDLNAIFDAFLTVRKVRNQKIKTRVSP